MAMTSVSGPCFVEFQLLRPRTQWTIERRSSSCALAVLDVSDRRDLDDGEVALSSPGGEATATSLSNSLTPMILVPIQCLLRPRFRLMPVPTWLSIPAIPECVVASTYTV